MFFETARRYSESVAVLLEDRSTYTYSELNEFSSEISGVITDRCLVVCLCGNNIASVAGYYGFLTNKIVPLMLEETTEVEVLLRLCAIYEPQYLWLPSDMEDIFPDSRHVLRAYGYSLIEPRGCKGPVLNDDLALLLTTSGSTGSPKFVRISYRNVFENAISIAKYLSLSCDDIAITTLPMSYSYGLSIINSHLLTGGKVALTNRSIIEKEFWNFLRHSQATSLSGVPYTYEILKRLRFFEMDLPHIKTLTQAGGKMRSDISLEISQFCRETGRNMFFMYGQTEATARMSYLPPDQTLNKPGSIGIPIPGGEFMLVDEQNEPILDSDKVGELVYTGPNVSMGYAFSAQDLRNGDVNCGFLRTGDLATRDDEGFYYIVGRLNRFVKLFGNRINLDEAERLLESVVDEAACIAGDEKMIIFITENNMSQEVRSFIAKKTGINFRAFEIRTISDIPKSNSGKINYTELASL